MKLSDPRIQTDSKVSAMRWGFIVAVKSTIAIIGVAVIASLVGTFLDKHVDLVGISAITSPLALFAFGGKATQTAFEQNGVTTDASTTPTTTNN